MPPHFPILASSGEICSLTNEEFTPCFDTERDKVILVFCLKRFATLLQLLSSPPKKEKCFLSAHVNSTTVHRERHERHECLDYFKNRNFETLTLTETSNWA